MAFKRSLFLFAAFASAVMVCSPAFGLAEVSVLQPDPAAGKDAQIGDGAVAGVNFGSGEEIIVNWIGNLRSVGLLQFDLGAIPPSTTVSSATLTLYQPYNSNQGSRYDIFRITSAWDEAAVTFNTAPTFDPAAFSSLVIPDNDFPTFRTWDVTTLVADWVDGSFTNHGMWIEEIPVAGDGDAYFSSSDNVVEEFRPSLTMEWIVPEPSAFVLAATSLFALSAVRRRR